MDVEGLKRSPIGRLEPIRVPDGENRQEVDYWAYVPKPLPQTLDISMKLITKAIDASNLLGQLKSFTSQLPMPELLARPIIRKEALSTSALEGTYAPAADVFASEVEPESTPSQPIREILNYVNATERATELLKSFPINISMLSELQKILVSKTSDEDWQAGQIRQRQVIIGPYPGCLIKEAFFVPPPPGEILKKGITEWERWIHNEAKELHSIFKVALAHYQFEALHPFSNGNGRIGRLVAILQLIESGSIEYPVLNLSPYFEKEGGQRYRMLLRELSVTGNYEEWIEYFLDAVTEQSKDGIRRAAELLDFKSEATSQVRANKRRGISVQIAEDLIGFPYFTVRTISDRYGVRYQSAQEAITILQNLGLVKVQQGKRAKIFHSPKVLEILFGN